MAKKKARKTARKAPARRTTARKTTTRKKAVRKTAGRKTAARKTAARKTAARKTAPRKAAARPAKITPASKTRTKGEIYNLIAGQTELSRKQVVSVFDALSGVLAADLGRRGPGTCNIPGLAKVVVQRKPATKARRGINPFTGEETTFKAKPARNVVKVRALKNLKTMV